MIALALASVPLRAGLTLPNTIAGMVGAMGVFGSAAVGTVLGMELNQLGEQPKVAQIP